MERPWSLRASARRAPTPLALSMIDIPPLPTRSTGHDRYQSRSRLSYFQGIARRVWLASGNVGISGGDRGPGILGVDRAERPSNPRSARSLGAASVPDGVRIHLQ